MNYNKDEVVERSVQNTYTELDLSKLFDEPDGIYEIKSEILSEAKKKDELNRKDLIQTVVKNFKGYPVQIKLFVYWLKKYFQYTEEKSEEIVVEELSNRIQTSFDASKFEGRNNGFEWLQEMPNEKIWATCLIRLYEKNTNCKQLEEVVNKINFSKIKHDGYEMQTSNLLNFETFQYKLKVMLTKVLNYLINGKVVDQEEDSLFYSKIIANLCFLSSNVEGLFHYLLVLIVEIDKKLMFEYKVPLSKFLEDMLCSFEALNEKGKIVIHYQVLIDHILYKFFKGEESERVSVFKRILKNVCKGINLNTETVSLLYKCMNFSEGFGFHGKSEFPQDQCSFYFSFVTINVDNQKDNENYLARKKQTALFLNFSVEPFLSKITSMLISSLWEFIYKRHVLRNNIEKNLEDSLSLEYVTTLLFVLTSDQKKYLYSELERFSVQLTNIASLYEFKIQKIEMYFLENTKELKNWFLERKFLGFCYLKWLKHFAKNKDLFENMSKGLITKCFELVSLIIDLNVDVHKVVLSLVTKSFFFYSKKSQYYSLVKFQNLMVGLLLKVFKFGNLHYEIMDFFIYKSVDGSNDRLMTMKILEIVEPPFSKCFATKLDLLLEKHREYYKTAPEAEITQFVNSIEVLRNKFPTCLKFLGTFSRF